MIQMEYYARTAGTKISYDTPLGERMYFIMHDGIVSLDSGGLKLEGMTNNGEIATLPQTPNNMQIIDKMIAFQKEHNHPAPQLCTEDM